MKTSVAALLILPLMAAPLAAENADQASFRPVPSQTSVTADPVRRADTNRVRMGQVKLAPASVADVDTNRDGRISFEELMAKDLALDF